MLTYCHNKYYFFAELPPKQVEAVSVANCYHQVRNSVRELDICKFLSQAFQGIQVTDMCPVICPFYVVTILLEGDPEKKNVCQQLTILKGRKQYIVDIFRYVISSNITCSQRSQDDLPLHTVNSDQKNVLWCRILLVENSSNIYPKATLSNSSREPCGTNT